jgi:phosphate transport system substrate-binding protein
MKKMAAAFGFAVILFFSMLFPETYAYSQDHLTASGCSVSNVGYLANLAMEYERKTGTKIFVRGGGSVVGIEDLRRGKVDFAAACRSRETGDPGDIEFIQVAWDVLVFIVHPTNPVDDISLDKARFVYFGLIRNWKSLDGYDMPVKIFISRPGKGLSGVEASMRSMLLNGRRPAEHLQMVSVVSSGIVEQMVEDTPEGFAATGFTSARKRSVKMLKVDGVAPSVENIVAKLYPLRRPLYLIVSRDEKPEVRKFIDFALSSEGQQFISSQGVVSLLDMK